MKALHSRELDGPDAGDPAVIQAGGERPHAIVIGLASLTGLQTARILAGRGVPVIAITRRPKHYCARTGVCARIIVADTSTDSLIDTLDELAPQLPCRGVLYPCSDLSVLTVSRNRERLAKNYHVVLPEKEVVETLLDKAGFHRYALENDLPVPATFFLRSREAALEAVDRIGYPCILKPAVKDVTWMANTRSKAYKVSSPEELLNLYDRCCEWTDVLIVQEWIAGPESNLYTCNCYLDGSSRTLVSFVTRKLRQWPPESGTGSLGQECHNETVLVQTIRLFEGIGFHGLGYLELKREDGTGRFLIVEPNIGRPTGRSATAERGGVELLYTMYCDTIGEPLPRSVPQRPGQGVKWIHLRRDLQAAWFRWREGELTGRQWWKSIRGPKAFAVFSWSDPAPFLGDVLRSLQLAIFGRRES